MKKTLLFIFTLVLSVATHAQTPEEAIATRNEIEASLPSNLPNLLAGKIICLDPGHGGHNSGNDRDQKYLGEDIGFNIDDIEYWESNGNFYTALYMREVLEELGAIVKLTRERNDIDIVNSLGYGNGGTYIGSGDPSLSTRANYAESIGADIFHSIHTNAGLIQMYDDEIDGTNYGGTHINSRDWSTSDPSYKCGAKMVTHMTFSYSYNNTNREYSHSVTDYNSSPVCILTEASFHTNPAEGRRLRSSMYLEANAMAWIKGYVDYYGNLSSMNWGEIGGIAYSTKPSEFRVGEWGDTYSTYSNTLGRNITNGYEKGLGLNNVKVTLDKGTSNERFVIIDQDEENANSDLNKVGGGYDGYYYFNFVPAGTHTLTFERVGVETVQKTVTVVNTEYTKHNQLLNVIGEPASAPTLSLVKPNGIDGVFAQWSPNYSASDLIGYRLFYATDDTKLVWKLAADETTIGASATSVAIPSKSNFIDATAITPKHFKVVAMTKSKGVKIVGNVSDVLSKYSGTTQGNILIVEGFDRRDGSYKISGNFITKYIYAIAGAEDVNISSTLNEFIISKDVNLMDFDAVVWVLGDESTVTSAFAWNERSVIDDYLDAGGNFFVSGSEIGWDLVEKGDVNDQAFYANYLKASFDDDGIAQTSVSGVASTIMDGVSIAIDDAYTAGYSDEISPINGAELVMKYSDATGAGVYYKGVFGAGTKEGSVMYLSFPVEAASVADMTKVFEKFIGTLDFTPASPEAPIANNDVAETTIDNAVVIDVLANDTDANRDIDINTLVVEAQPSNGSAIIENGKIRYTPNVGYQGNDLFTYSIKDGQPAVSNIATVNISVVKEDCILTATSTDTYFVRYVLFKDLDGNSLLENLTSNDGGYADYMSQTISTELGKTYRFMGRGLYGIDNSVNPSYWKVWIDFDGDGAFDGVNEEVASKEGDAYAFTNFVIPASVATGTYTLRIATSSQPITSACGVIVEGEIEDYSISVTANTLNDEELSELSIKAYPNPFVDVINLEISDVSSVVIYSMLGKVVYSKDNVIDNQNINTNNWDKGVYLITVGSRDKRSVIKMIKK